MKKIPMKSKYTSLVITIGIFVTLVAIGSFAYDNFFGAQNLVNLLIDNSFLMIVALGETLVIISGGIDLSVGSLIALVSMIAAYLLTTLHYNPVVVMLIAIAVGGLIGLLHGILITYFNVQPFIATLAGMFLTRGLSYVISTDTISISDPTFVAISEYRIPFLFDSFLSIGVMVTLFMLLLYVYLAHYTKFGRAIYAIGSSEQSARLMGLPVNRTKILVYVLSGFTSSIGGLVFSFYMLSGYGSHATGLELDAIAGTVVGGTLMTGGVGFVVGTVFGVLIEGIIQTFINFQGDLNSWWTRIAIAVLLLIFIAVQRMLVARRERKKSVKEVKTIERAAVAD
jgi:ribose/xylose/arabinose/galactoside ABC-type transport system permease subunit